MFKEILIDDEEDDEDFNNFVSTSALVSNNFGDNKKIENNSSENEIEDEDFANFISTSVLVSNNYGCEKKIENKSFNFNEMNETSLRISNYSVSLKNVRMILYFYYIFLG